MGQTLPEFQRLHEWEKMAKKLASLRPERYGHIDIEKVVCYAITNKENDKETSSARPYEMQVDKLPMRMSNQFNYFIWFKNPQDWHEKPVNCQAAMVMSALERIDPDKPFNVRPLDYRDQNVMAHTFGIDWCSNPNIPNILEDNINIRE